MSIFTRNHIALFGNYEKAFFSKAYKEGLVKPIDFGDQDLDVSRIAENEYEKFYKHNNKKTSVLQMFLLYDTITLLDSELPYDYSKLKSSGLVNVITSDEEPILLGYNEWDLATRNYAIYLKPLVMRKALEGLSKSELSELKREYGLTANTFFSGLFDLCMSPDNSSHNQETLEKIDSFISTYTERTYLKYKDDWSSKGVSKDLAIEFTRSRWTDHIVGCIGKLMSIIDFSNQMNAVVMQNEYNSKDNSLINLNGINDDFSQGLEAYGVLRVSYEKLVSALPRLDKIEDVIRLKEKRSKDINRLKDVITEVESALVEGKSCAINTANKLIEKALKDLNRGLTLQKVSKWTTYSSLPIAAIESYMQMPPLLGISAGMIGTTSTFSLDSIEKKNNWLNVIR